MGCASSTPVAEEHAREFPSPTLAEAKLDEEASKHGAHQNTSSEHTDGNIVIPDEPESDNVVNVATENNENIPCEPVQSNGNKVVAEKDEIVPQVKLQNENQKLPMDESSKPAMTSDNSQPQVVDSAFIESESSANSALVANPAQLPAINDSKDTSEPLVTATMAESASEVSPGVEKQLQKDEAPLQPNMKPPAACSEPAFENSSTQGKSLELSEKVEIPSKANDNQTPPAEENNEEEIHAGIAFGRNFIPTHTTSESALQQSAGKRQKASDDSSDSQKEINTTSEESDTDWDSVESNSGNEGDGLKRGVARQKSPTARSPTSRKQYLMESSEGSSEGSLDENELFKKIEPEPEFKKPPPEEKEVIEQIAPLPAAISKSKGMNVDTIENEGLFEHLVEQLESSMSELMDDDEKEEDKPGPAKSPGNTTHETAFRQKFNGSTLNENELDTKVESSEEDFSEPDFFDDYDLTVNTPKQLLSSAESNFSLDEDDGDVDDILREMRKNAGLSASSHHKTDALKVAKILPSEQYDAEIDPNEEGKAKKKKKAKSKDDHSQSPKKEKKGVKEHAGKSPKTPKSPKKAKKIRSEEDGKSPKKGKKGEKASGDDVHKSPKKEKKEKHKSKGEDDGGSPVKEKKHKSSKDERNIDSPKKSPRKERKTSKSPHKESKKKADNAINTIPDLDERPSDWMEKPTYEETKRKNELHSNVKECDEKKDDEIKQERPNSGTTAVSDLDVSSPADHNASDTGKHDKKRSKKEKKEKKQKNKKQHKGSKKILEFIDKDPWDEGATFDEEAFINLINEHPEFCGEKFKLEAFDAEIYPLSAICALRPSLKAVKKCHKAAPGSIEDNDGGLGTPLHYACSFKAPFEVIDFILEKWPDALKAVDEFDRTPLHAAALFQAESRAISLLIENYPEAASISDEEKFTPLHLAIEAENDVDVDAVQELVKASPSSCTSQSLTDCVTPLMLAVARQAPLKVLKVIVRGNEQSLKIPDKAGRIPLHVAAALKADEKTLKFLKKHFPEGVSVRDNSGFRPIDLAKKVNADKDIQALLET